jgi:hypothetical protein
MPVAAPLDVPASLSACALSALPRSHVWSVHVYASNRVVYHGYGASRRLAVPEQPQECRRDDGVPGVGWRLTRRLLHSGLDAAPTGGLTRM